MGIDILLSANIVSPTLQSKSSSQIHWIPRKKYSVQWRTVTGNPLAPKVKAFAMVTIWPLDTWSIFYRIIMFMIMLFPKPHKRRNYFIGCLNPRDVNLGKYPAVITHWCQAKSTVQYLIYLQKFMTKHHHLLPQFNGDQCQQQIWAGQV